MDLSNLIFPAICLVIITLLAIPFALTIQTLFKRSTTASWVIGVGSSIGLLIFFRFALVILFSIHNVEYFYFPIWLYYFYMPVIASGAIASLLIYFFIKINRKKHTKQKLVLGAASLFAVSSFTSWLVIWLFSPGSFPMLANYHYFNDHIKSLCVYRENKIECPRNEEQLAAFNQEKWREFNQTATVTYTFDEATQKYIFVAEDPWLKLVNNDVAPGYMEVVKR